MFKLAQGEYVAAERIETILTKHEFISQVFVYGDSLQATLVGIVGNFQFFLIIQFLILM